MAKLTGPLMSMGASGTIGKLVTFGKWKGINTARQRVVPSNPNSTAQQAQRGIMGAVVAFWRGFLTGTGGKAAWNREATSSGKAQSGFNAFTSSSVKASAQVADASFDVGNIAVLEADVGFTMANLDDGATGSEAGTFTLLVGSAPSQMLNSYSDSILAGALSFDPSADFNVGDVIYCQILKDVGTIVAAKRSGIYQLTLA